MAAKVWVRAISAFYDVKCNHKLRALGETFEVSKSRAFDLIDLKIAEAYDPDSEPDPDTAEVPEIEGEATDVEREGIEIEADGEWHEDTIGDPDSELSLERAEEDEPSDGVDDDASTDPDTAEVPGEPEE